MKTYKEAFEEFRTKYFTEVLREANNCVTTAARISGKNRTHFYHVMKKAKVQRANNPPGRKPREEGNAAWRELQ